MTQPNLLELAKQGDAQAIASTINYLLQDKHITAKAVLKDLCLHVLLESAQVPEQQSSVRFIRNVMKKLAVKSIKSVKIYAKKTGQQSVAWSDYLTLIDDVEKPQNDLGNLGVKYQDNQKAAIWPVWIPYFNSWCRAFILIPLIASIGFITFRLTGFWGLILSGITNQLEIFIIILILGILLPMFLVAYIHTFFVSLWKKQPISSIWPRWLPSANSLWEGFYAEVVMFLSLLITIFIILPFLPINNCYHEPLFTSCLRYSEIVLKQYIDKYSIDKIGSSIWIVTAAYLYQIEYLFRHRFIPKVKIILTKYQSKRQPDSVDNTDLDLDRLLVDMGVTQMQKGKKQQLQMTYLPQQHNQKPKQLNKRLLILLLIPLVALGIYSFSKLSQFQETITLPIASKISTELPSKTIAVTPSALTSKSPNFISQSDNFREAVNQAISAANLTQSAKNPDEWKIIVSQWQAAIALMNKVPSSSPNYSIAQQKITEYQRNLSYAQKNATGGK
ncbi:hypothetical protein I8748_03110 [Nostoc sp. CENA67]|uniref:Uncharacterized protein n=1 Tax=Amazonocrinis nigriterrae CENA67 TaxID=2794033 RepID=A0A8J7HKD4_9NOST|nr:hypothetical protein [Amazonocrinis nigriterrae]MBH8561176.1 hypothetical protein [Amazonocrinis nigriterrae CENA67]